MHRKVVARNISRAVLRAMVYVCVCSVCVCVCSNHGLTESHTINEASDDVSRHASQSTVVIKTDTIWAAKWTLIVPRDEA